MTRPEAKIHRWLLLLLLLAILSLSFFLVHDHFPLQHDAAAGYYQEEQKGRRFLRQFPKPPLPTITNTASVETTTTGMIPYSRHQEEEEKAARVDKDENMNPPQQPQEPSSLLLRHGHAPVHPDQEQDFWSALLD